MSSLAVNAARSNLLFRFTRDFVKGAPWFLAASALALLAFAVLAGFVIGGDTRDIDERILLALRSTSNISDAIGPRWLQGAMRDVTALGGFAILSIVVLGVSGFLAATGRHRMALRIFAISLSGWLMMNAVKLAFLRPRPDLVPHGADVYATSFPSGHAMTSAVVYLTLGAALAGTTDDRSAKMYIASLAIALTLAIGVSRVYLGVHWPTDVLGGWILGAAWVGLAWPFFTSLDQDAERRKNAKFD